MGLALKWFAAVFIMWGSLSIVMAGIWALIGGIAGLGRRLFRRQHVHVWAGHPELVMRCQKCGVALQLHTSEYP